MSRYKGEREIITVRVPSSLKPRLQRVARARGVAVSDLVSDLLEREVPEVERQEGLPQQAEFDFELEQKSG